MKKKLIVIMTLVLVSLLAFGSIAMSASDDNVSEDATTVIARFVVTDTTLPGNDFDMQSEDGETVIRVSDDTPVYFEDYVPLGDEPEDGVTRIARDVLFGRTLAEVLNGRNLVVTFDGTAVTSVTILFEGIMPLGGESIDGEQLR